jgi:poly-gamma-glutamate capsule biosynthesis protein CapA/YwtB (metallophosphatase superfamily)
VTEEFSIAAAGDALMTRRVPLDVGRAPLRDVLTACDARFVNLEGTLHRFEGHPQAASGGAYVCGHPDLLDDLRGLGFNLFGAANNHMVDWGEGGLLATMAALERAGAVYAGVGRHLADARAARFLETPGGRVALLAVTSTFPPHALAGEQRPDCQGRPGVNPLRFEETIHVDAPMLGQLREADRRLGLSAERDLRLRLGFVRPEPEDVAVLFGHRFRVANPPGVHTAPHAGDLAANLRWIADARRQADWVVVSVHAHEMLGGDREQPAAFIPAFCRRAVEAGADAVLGHGPHLLRGLEVYRGKPIFYSLGNFIFQNETVLRQPADFYERFGLGAEATPADVFDARAAGGGFPADPLYWESVVAVCRFRGGGLAEIRLHPVVLGYGRPRPQRGNPEPASADIGRAIAQRVGRLSPSVGIEWHAGFGCATVHW